MFNLSLLGGLTQGDWAPYNSISSAFECTEVNLPIFPLQRSQVQRFRALIELLSTVTGLTPHCGQFQIPWLINGVHAMSKQICSGSSRSVGPLLTLTYHLQLLPVAATSYSHLAKYLLAVWPSWVALARPMGCFNDSDQLTCDYFML